MRIPLAWLVAILPACGSSVLVGGAPASDAPGLGGGSGGGGSGGAGGRGGTGGRPGGATLEPVPPTEPPPPPEPRPPEPPPGAQCDAPRAVLPVHNGTLAPTVVPLTPGQVLAIGFWGGCSGALIAPRWALTAIHCGIGRGDRFCMGEDPSRPDVCIQVVATHDSPQTDTTLAELAEDATTRLPGVVPIPILRERLDDGWVGRTAEAAGYGQQENGSSGERRFSAERITRLEGDLVHTDGAGRNGVCYGDSGGPFMVVASDGTARVAGDVSGGDGTCDQLAWYARVDVNVAWIDGLVGTQPEPPPPPPPPPPPDGGAAGGAPTPPPPPPPDPCGGIDALGVCEGDVARWCEGGTVRARDCAACDRARCLRGDRGVRCG